MKGLNQLSNNYTEQKQLIKIGTLTSKNLKHATWIACMVVTLLITGCASNKSIDAQSVAANSAQEDKTENPIADVPISSEVVNTDAKKVSDPLESFNRVMWDFNYDVLDKFFIKPLTKGYIFVTPQFLRTGLLNAANNIEEPANMINNLLQGKPSGSAVSLARFALNSTVGLLGFFDVASNMGLPVEEEDFGQVLGVWGVGTGPYLMLPALGPSDIRSLTGTVVDNYYWPSTVLEDPYIIAAKLVSVLETRAVLLDQEENLNRALDPYLFVRDAYFQRLAFEVSDGKIKQKTEEEIEKDEDDFSDFEDLLNGG